MNASTCCSDDLPRRAAPAPASRNLWRALRAALAVRVEGEGEGALEARAGERRVAFGHRVIVFPRR